jgi:signal transduction histidine kinase
MVGKNIGDILPGLAFCEVNYGVHDPEKRIEIMIPKNAKPRYFDVLVMPLGERTGNVSGHLFLLRDITDRKQSELALASAHKKINLLSSITRHDINNKLQAVQNYLELTRLSAKDPVQIGYIDREEMAVQAIQEQIGFSREYEQIGVEAPIWENIDACVERTLPQVDTKNVTVTCTTGALEVFVDPMCEKVCYNLLDNAIKYGGAGISKITLSAQPSGSDMLIIVEDDGEGIAPDDKDHLFERGFGRNTGLGLFLSREILAITDIVIRETSAPGHGARFEIRVPEGKFRFGSGG